MAYSKLDQLINVDIAPMFQYGKHSLTVGESGSGKTTVLFLQVWWFFNNGRRGDGETVIWRDDGSLEALSFADDNLMPVQCLIPEGCTLEPRNNIPVKTFDILRPETVLDVLENRMLNILCLDLYIDNIAKRCEFYALLLFRLYRWAQQSTHDPVAVIIDQLNELAPGERLQMVPQQDQSSKQIYNALINFRKHNIRLVGASHNYTDLLPGIRENFQYYWIKNMRRDAVPERFWNFASLIEKLSINKAIVVDDQGSFNRISVEPIIFPRKHKRRFTVSPEIEKVQAPILTIEQMVRWVLSHLEEFNDEKGGVSVYRIASTFEVPLSSKAYQVKAEVQRRLKISQQQKADADDLEIVEEPV